MNFFARMTHRTEKDPRLSMTTKYILLYLCAAYRESPVGWGLKEKICHSIGKIPLLLLMKRGTERYILPRLVG